MATASMYKFGVNGAGAVTVQKHALVVVLVTWRSVALPHAAEPAKGTVQQQSIADCAPGHSHQRANKSGQQGLLGLEATPFRTMYAYVYNACVNSLSYN